MKKALAIVMTALMVITLGITVFAAPDGFISSPSVNPNPEVSSFTTKDGESAGVLVVTAYADKDTLPEGTQDLMVKAYESITKSAADLTKLAGDLAKLADKKGVEAKNLAVSDLFDLTCTKEGNGYVIALDMDTLKNFVGLLHMKHNGEWEVISDAKVDEDGKTISFTVDSLSPFAVVVSVEDIAPAGNNALPFIVIGAVVAVAAVVLVILFVKKKKKEEEQ